MVFLFLSPLTFLVEKMVKSGILPFFLLPCAQSLVKKWYINLTIRPQLFVSLLPYGILKSPNMRWPGFALKTSIWLLQKPYQDMVYSILGGFGIFLKKIQNLTWKGILRYKTHNTWDCMFSLKFNTCTTLVRISQGAAKCVKFWSAQNITAWFCTKPCKAQNNKPHETPLGEINVLCHQRKESQAMCGQNEPIGTNLSTWLKSRLLLEHVD
jgi:hypothetical protein